MAAVMAPHGEIQSADHLTHIWQAAFTDRGRCLKMQQPAQPIVLLPKLRRAQWSSHRSSMLSSDASMQACSAARASYDGLLQ